MPRKNTGSDHTESLFDAPPMTQSEARLLDLLESEAGFEVLEWRKYLFSIDRPDGCESGVKFIGALNAQMAVMIYVPD